MEFIHLKMYAPTKYCANKEMQLRVVVDYCLKIRESANHELNVKDFSEYKAVSYQDVAKNALLLILFAVYFS
jgi:hypothetical protein